MKKDALQKGLPVPDQAAVRERVLVKNVEAPDLTTAKDFFRFCAATGKGKIITIHPPLQFCRLFPSLSNRG
jgi:hypothetical protein